MLAAQAALILLLLKARECRHAGVFGNMILWASVATSMNIARRDTVHLPLYAGSSGTVSTSGGRRTAAATDSKDTQGGKAPTTGTSSPEFTAEAERLEGPSSGVCTACDMDLALGVITQPGGSGQRSAMIAAAAAAWPDDAAGVLALLLLEDVVLERGQACLIPAGCPHAYVCGKC